MTPASPAPAMRTRFTGPSDALRFRCCSVTTRAQTRIAPIAQVVSNQSMTSTERENAGSDPLHSPTTIATPITADAAVVAARSVTRSDTDAYLQSRLYI